MRKKWMAAIVAAFVCIAACALTACKGLDRLNIDGLPDSFEGMSIAEGKSAFDLYGEALANFLAEEDYRRVQYYDFTTTSGATQSMQIKTTRKINGNRIYNEEVVLAAGVMSLNEGKKVYFNGEEAHSLYFNDKARVPGKGEDVFAVTDWDLLGNYDAERYGAIADTRLSYKTQLLSYNLAQASFLADTHDDTVYLNDSKFYFALNIDCSDTAMKGAQRSVAEAIAKKTASSPDDLKMRENTEVRAEVRKIDGKMRFTYLQIKEVYKGKLSIFNAECKTSYYNEFYYGAGAGTATDAELNGIGNR